MLRKVELGRRVIEKLDHATVEAKKAVYIEI